VEVLRKVIQLSRQHGRLPASFIGREEKNLKAFGKLNLGEGKEGFCWGISILGVFSAGKNVVSLW
jgi:hypothetical protein